MDTKTYQKDSGLSSKIKSDINATLDFTEYKLNDNYLNSSNINRRIINIVDYGKLTNVEIKVTINGGK